MIYPIFAGLIVNAALLVALVVVFRGIGDGEQRSSAWLQAASGVLIGAFAVMVMLFAWEYRPGVFFDTRTVLLSTAALFVGYVPALVAMVVALIYRLWVGGPGVLVGGLTIVTATAIGLLWRKWRAGPRHQIKWTELYVFGLVVHVVVLALMLALPRSMAQDLLGSLALPMLLIYPVVTVLIGTLLAKDLYHRQVHLDLIRQHDLLERIAENTPTGLVVFDREGRIVFANDYVVELLGLTRQSVLASSYDLPIARTFTLDGEQVPALKMPFQQVVATEERLEDLRYRVELPGGREIYVSVNAAPMFDLDEQLERVIVTFTNISGQLADQARIDHLNRLLRAMRDINQLITRQKDADVLIKAACENLIQHRGCQRVMIIRLSPDGELESFAQAGRDGTEPPLPDCMQKGMLPACCQALLMEGELPNQPAPADSRLVCQDAQACYLSGAAVYRLDHDGVLYGFLLTIGTHDEWHGQEERQLFHDLAADLGFALHAITLESIKKQAELERRRIEQRLQDAHRLETVGQLAGGIAHDFNNLLTIVIGQAELIKMRTHELSTKQRLKEIVTASNRAAALVRQLLAFSRRQVLEEVRFPVNDRLKHLREMLQRVLDANQHLVLELDLEVGFIKADRSQFDQIFLNLTENAREAMGEAGTLTIQTQLAEWHDREPDAPSLPAGKLVRIRVSDTGPGLDPTARARLFEPFFTTKGQAKHSGLGLSTVLGIVSQFGGHIAVSSVADQGAVFTIWLPPVSADQEATPKTPPAAPVKRDKTILVVEDEHPLRLLIGELLQADGYQVLLAANGPQALAVAETHRGSIDLLVTDIVMPHMRGTMLASIMGRQRPEIEVLLISGNQGRVSELSETVHQEDGFLRKPFTPSELRSTVSRILGD